MKDFFNRMWNNLPFFAVWFVVAFIGAMLTGWLAKESMDWFFGGMLSFIAADFFQTVAKDVTKMIRGY